jgi:phosphate transport system substrate-binding protein
MTTSHGRRILASATAIAVCVGGERSARRRARRGRPEDPSDEKTSGISGNLSSVGSDTLNNLMTLWAEAFKQLYPNVRIQIEGKGSSTAPPALISGTAQIGPMSRPMKPSEIDEFEKKFGYRRPRSASRSTRSRST